MTAGGGDLEGLGALGARLDVDHLAGLHAEGGAVDDLAVDHDVTVHDELAGLRRGAREAGADDERVEALLEDLDEVLTGQALRATRLWKAILSWASRMPYWARRRCFSRRRTA